MEPAQRTTTIIQAIIYAERLLPQAIRAYANTPNDRWYLRQTIESRRAALGDRVLTIRVFNHHALGLD